MMPRASGSGRAAVAVRAASDVLGASPNPPRMSMSSGPLHAASAVATPMPVTIFRDRCRMRYPLSLVPCPASVRRVSAVTPKPLDQRHEAHRPQFVILVAGLVPGDADELLHSVRLAHGQYHDTADPELGQERAGRILGSGGYQNTVERSLVRQPEAAIGGQRDDIGDVELGED